MIKQLEYSESIRIPSDQKMARAALRLLGAFQAGTAILDVSSADIFADKVRRELLELYVQRERDKQSQMTDPVLLNRIERLQNVLKEYGRER
jgi:hypothetical protein